MQWSVPPIGERPHQPISFRFPQQEFGQKTVTKRSFQAKWFSKWPWLHYSYNEDSNSVYCFHCIKAYSQNKLLGCVSNLEKTYISTGFANWKQATSRFASWLVHSYDLIQHYVLLMKLIKISEAII